MAISVNEDGNLKDLNLKTNGFRIDSIEMFRYTLESHSSPQSFNTSKPLGSYRFIIGTIAYTPEFKNKNSGNQCPLIGIVYPEYIYNLDTYGTTGKPGAMYIGNNTQTVYIQVASLESNVVTVGAMSYSNVLYPKIGDIFCVQISSAA